MANIKIFCVTKNEYDLIEHFIVYYGYLFGYNNIIIIDNNSTHKLVLEIYEKYIKLGIKVVYEPNYKGTGQGDMFTKYMSLEKLTCDFLIGLDTDEFLFSYDDLKNEYDPFCKEKILQIFDSYNANDTLFKINSYPISVPDKLNKNYINNQFINPAAEIVYFSDYLPTTKGDSGLWNTVGKYFVRSNAFKKTSNGNHVIETNYGNSVASNLGLLHFNNTGIRRFFERAKSVIDGYGYFSTFQDISRQIDILSTIGKVDGYHKVRDYHAILLRKFILELFITYIKRLPSVKELEYHTDSNFYSKSSIIEHIFKNCNEAILNRDIIFVFDDEIEKNDLVFYDIPLEEVSSKYKVYKITYLQELFSKIMCN